MIRTHKTKLNGYERATLFNVITALGGMLVVSDRLMDYSQSERELLLKAMELFEMAKDGDIYCHNLLAGALHSFYNTKGPGVVLNMGETPCVSSPAHEIIKEYNHIYIIENNAKIPFNAQSFELAPHSSKLFIFGK